ncbi:MAG: cadherin-like domain-containing protein [Geminicoccaceae bacterium]
MVVRLGLAGSDTLTGTRGNDILVDIGGSNTLSGLAGNDAITGGSDGDTAYGGAGTDLLLGLGGTDVLDGGSDGDRLWGGGGDDSLIGGSGHDVLDGGSGRDTAVYDGARAAYRLTELGGGVIEVQDLEPGLAGDDGTDRLTGVERLVFADGEVIVGQQPNRAPDAVADSLAAQAEDAAPRTIAFAELTGNDTDPDGDPLVVSAVGNATGGTVAIVAGEVVFTADADFNGAASFDYTVSDGKGGVDTASAGFTVTAVNDAPEATDDTLASQAEDASSRTIAFAELTANDHDLDGDALTVSAVGNATGGMVAIVAGEVVFTADADFNGAASFDYTVSDGKGGTDTATASFAVTAVNDAPEASNDTLASQAEDGEPRTIAFAELTDNDDDIDGDKLTISDVGNARGGNVAIVAGEVVFTADADFNGSASFDYTLSDGKGGVDTATASFTVTPVNDAPEATDDTLQDQAEDASPRTIAFAKLTGNDNDVDGDALTVSAVGKATGGSVAIVAGEVVFTADADFNGAASFDYTLSDGKGGSDTATASFTVKAVNDAPEAADDTLAGQEQGSGARIIAFAELTGNDRDVDGDGLTVTAVGHATGGTVTIDGGTVVFVADAGFSGNASFEYTVGDGKGGSDTATASFAVTPVDDGPSLFTTGDDIVDLNAFDLTAFPGRGATDALAGNDTVTLSTRQNLGVRFDGNTGNDTVQGTGGADWIAGGDDADRIEGGADRDTLDGGAGADSIVGGNGGDSLLGGTGDDHLVDDFGNDRLFGGNGSDTLVGGRGNDALYGGAAADSMEGGTGFDTAFYEGSGVRVDLGNAANNRFGEAEGDVLSGIEGVEGTAAGDFITGDAFINPLSGNAGNDTLAGAAGNDFLLGGAGDDTLTGGSGLDGFVFAPGGGSDRVTDFVHGEDFIELKDYPGLAFADLVFVADPDDTVIDLGASGGGAAGVDLVRLVSVTTLVEADFIFAA